MPGDMSYQQCLTCWWISKSISPSVLGPKKDNPNLKIAQHTEVVVVVSVLAIMRFGHPFWGHNRPLKIKAKRSNKYHQFWTESLHKTFETPQYFGFVPVQRKEEQTSLAWCVRERMWFACASFWMRIHAHPAALFAKVSCTE